MPSKEWHRSQRTKAARERGREALADNAILQQSEASLKVSKDTGRAADATEQQVQIAKSANTKATIALIVSIGALIWAIIATVFFHSS
jgi:hypothetical protein